MVGQLQGCEFNQDLAPSKQLGARARPHHIHQKQFQNLLLFRQALAWLVMVPPMG
jgi:hypothetical protein